MTREEFSKFMDYISNGVGIASPKSREPYWDFLEEMPFPLADAVAKQVVMEYELPTFPPVALILRKAREIEFGEPMSWSEAWHKVRSVIKTFSAHRMKEGLDTLPPAARQAVERLGWKEMCDGNAADFMEPFKQIYEELSRKEMANAKMPETIRSAAAKGVGKK